MAATKTLNPEDISLSDLRPAERINTAQMGKMDYGMGQTIEAPIFEMRTWYHPDGTSSELPVHLDRVYEHKTREVNGRFVDWFFKDKPAGWDKLAGAFITCPLVRCGNHIKLTSETDDEALQAIGIEPTPKEERERNAVLGHFKRKHEAEFANMVRRGVVSPDTARYL